jgi:hypothetical protein
MSSDNIKEEYKIGYPIFEEIFSKSDKEVKEIILSITDNDKEVKEILKNGKLIRTIVDEKPTKIKINFYDSIELSYLGLNFQPEHGPDLNLIKFNKHFKL